MPFSFIDIERKKSRIISSLFFILIGFYFFNAYLILLIFQNTVFPIFDGIFKFAFPSWTRTLWTLIIAFIAAFLHWKISTTNMLPRMTEAIDAERVDDKDEYHLYFKNIVDEVCVAIGGRRIEAWVIPISSKNAFALEDFSGCAIIGVTEGLITRLNRRQIEAVVAHEAGHIVSGDCLSTTISCSLAELYEGILSNLTLGLKNTRGRGVAFIGLLYIVLASMRLLSNLTRFFISREREYRADAISVRLTRNPLSLAEALKLISSNWRGTGSLGERIQSIFIVNPELNWMDEEEGFFANLFSTHPPVKRRIKILLDMAHLDEKTLEENLRTFKRVSPIALAEYRLEDQAQLKKWSVFTDQQWSEPMALADIKKLDGFKPDQWVRRAGQGKVRYAYNEPELLDLFSGPDKSGEKLNCPHCRTALEEIIYEGAPVYKCSYCGGVLAGQNKVRSILIREDKEFSPEVMRLAHNIIASREKIQYYRAKEPQLPWIINCPKCQQKMHRHFFVYSYPVEIDQCNTCEVYWLDKDELEILQYLYKNKQEIFC